MAATSVAEEGYAMKTDTISVAGATLYYEVRGPLGARPTLLLICGGVYDAAGYAGLAEQLADRYTVVTGTGSRP
jgi:hypothetical protein